jgi:hypothetical protein
VIYREEQSALPIVVDLENQRRQQATKETADLVKAIASGKSDLQTLDPGCALPQFLLFYTPPLRSQSSYRPGCYGGCGLFLPLLLLRCCCWLLQLLSSTAAGVSC